MRKSLQLAASWILYGVGHCVFLVLDRFAEYEDERERPHWVCRVLWRPYQFCMVVSSRLDEWGVLWTPASKPQS